MNLERFGRLPSGADLERVRSSPHFKDKSFKNTSNTPALTEGVSFWIVLYEFLFKKNKRVRPSSVIPVVKTDLKNLDPKENLLVWFGHSSYFMQVDGRKILVDPVFSGNASPLNFTTRSFTGTDLYTPEDFPEIDYLFLSHDHWDHLDYKTIKGLKSKIRHIVCGLGVATHLLRWRFDPKIISEKDWGETINLEDGFEVHTTSGRHFSGRGFKRNQSLWMSYVLLTPTQKIFIGGDSGYDTHFAAIGQEFGPFDWAILECGQYDKNWKYIHMLPEEVVKAALELRAKTLLPVHWAKFSLGNHEWDAPVIEVSKIAKENNVPVKTPMIGAVLYLDQPEQQTARWWEGLQ